MIGAHHSQQGSRRWLSAVLRWIAGLGVLGVLLYFLPFATVRKAIAQVPAWLFLGTLVGYLLAHTLGIAKWRMVVNAAGAELNFATSAQCYTGGLFGTLFLPSIIGGDVVRLAVGLRRRPRPAAVLTGNAVDRFLDMAAQAGLLAIGMSLFMESEVLSEEMEIKVQEALGVAAAAGLALVAVLFLLRRAILAGRSVRFRRRLARFRYALRLVSRRKRVLFAG